MLEGTGSLPAQAVYSEALYARYHFGWSELTALTDARYRYIQAPTDELYDLERDPRRTAEHRRRSRPGTGATGAARRARTVARGRDDRGAGKDVGRRPRTSAGARLRGRAGGVTRAPAASAARSQGQLRDSRDATARPSISPSTGSGARRSRCSSGSCARIRAMADAWEQRGGLCDSGGAPRSGDRRVQALHRARAGGPGRLSRRGRGDAQGSKARRRARACGARRQCGWRSATRARARPRTNCWRESRSRATMPRAPAARQSSRESDDPKLPLPAYIEARLLYDQGKYADALALFEQAIAELKRSGDRTIADLHFYTADALVHLERYAEAEREFLAELEALPSKHQGACRPGHAVSRERPERRRGARARGPGEDRADSGRVRAGRAALDDVREPAAGRRATGSSEADGTAPRPAFA